MLIGLEDGLLVSYNSATLRLNLKAHLFGSGISGAGFGFSSSAFIGRERFEKVLAFSLHKIYQ